MTSQDGLAQLRQMHERGEITDEQYDALRRHVLWGTPLPDLEDVPSPRSGADPVGGYVPGAATVGPDRSRYAGPAGRPVGPSEATGPAPQRYASRRERREAEEARAHYPAPPAHPAQDYPPPADQPRGFPPRDYPLPDYPPPADRPPSDPPPRGFQPPDYPPPAESTGPLPPVGGVAPPRRHRRREEAPAPEATGSRAPTEQPSSRRHRRLEQAAPPDELTTRRGRRPAGSEPEPDRPRRRAGETAGREPQKAGKRRPRRRSVVAVLTSVVLALALAAGGVYWFELRRQGLPPTAYARQACGTVRDWQQAVDSSNATLIGQISREQNKATIRSDVTAYYTTIAGRTDQLRVAILDLGPADLPAGQEYTDSLAAAVGDQASGLRRLAAQATRLNPAAATFPTDLQGILTGTDAAVSAVSAALARPAAGITTELRTTLSNEPACAPYVG